MNRKTPGQRHVSLILMATLLALSGTIPVLDLMVGDGKAAVEAEHIPGTHGFPHNHLICIQHKANHWIPQGDTPTPRCLVVVSLPAFPNAESVYHQEQVLLPLARAPPVA